MEWFTNSDETIDGQIRTKTISKGGINSCDIPYTDDLKAFFHEYDTLTEKVAAECESAFQFHHVQMDGGHGAMFLELLQREIRNC